MTEQTRRHYVYALVDPRDGKPFYIGKGVSTKRMHQHILAARSYAKGGWSDGNKAMLDQILEIEAAGLAVTQQVLAEFDSSAEAFSYEKLAIAADDTLTNVHVGGGSGCSGWSAAELKRRVDRGNTPYHSSGYHLRRVGKVS